MLKLKTIPWMAAVAVCMALGISACGGDPGQATDSDESDATARGEAPLPKPQASSGSVTGMPAKPGPNRIEPIAPIVEQPDPDTSMADAENDDLADAPDAAGDPATGDSILAASAEPTPQDAVAVVRDYYDALDSHDFARAFALWADGGRASGQTPQQFADGFANTADVAVQAAPPGPVGAAAGSRYVEIPVTIESTQRDGSVRQYAGSYTLRRAMVDGASTEQRAWRIASARLHEVTP
jgi:hypothetical protein